MKEELEKHKNNTNESKLIHIKSLEGSDTRIKIDEKNYLNLIYKFESVQKPLLKEIELACGLYEKLDLQKLMNRGWQEEITNDEDGKDYVEFCYYHFLNNVKDTVRLILRTYSKEKTEVREIQKEKEIKKIFTLRGQVEQFLEIQPIFYDPKKLWWIWNKQDSKWIKIDDTDALVSINDSIGIDTINSKIKNEIVNGLKQLGRRCEPKKIDKSWIQFKNKIYDVKTGEHFKASPEYFVTNPIPWEVGETEDTPTIDKIFEQWVGKEYVETLYQFLAYSTCQDKFMQRIFAFCGGGSNGKGTFIKLNKKFIGNENCVASEMKPLSEDRFEASNLYKKLLCVMGEVSHSDLTNTNMLKKLGGEDDISFQFKGKDSFTEENTATCVCLTNSLPKTPDTSIGFYRKWQIIDLPNQFSGIKNDVVSLIPNVEFNNLAKKCLRILEELYETRKFANEGDFENRRDRYEERSNPVMKFLETNYTETVGCKVILRSFVNKCNDYLKLNRLRLINSKQIGKILREEGFAIGNRKDEIGNSFVVILNLKLRTIETIETEQKLISEPTLQSNSNLDSFNSYNSF